MLKVKWLQRHFHDYNKISMTYENSLNLGMKIIQFKFKYTFNVYFNIILIYVYFFIKIF